MNIKKLEETVMGKGSTKGFTYKRVFENEGWYIYQMIVPTGEHRKPYFEVFKKKIVHPLISGTLNTDKTKWMELYPSDAVFGNWAWGVNSIERAMEIISKKMPQDDKAIG